MTLKMKIKNKQKRAFQQLLGDDLHSGGVRFSCMQGVEGSNFPPRPVRYWGIGSGRPPRESRW